MPALTRARTILEESLASKPPVVTVLWVVICMAVYGASMIGAIDGSSLAMSPATVRDEPATLITSMFMHGDLTHLGMNMLGLWLFGSVIEREIGSIFVGLALLVSGIAGGLAFIALEAGSHTQVVGASGSVFGIMGALLLLHVLRRSGSVGAVLVLVAVNTVYGFVVPGIAWQAHLGGLVAGAAMGLLAVPVLDTRRRREIERARSRTVER